MSMPTDGQWRDATSYSRGERPAETEPRTWKLEVGKVSVMVTKHIHYGDEWTFLAPDLGITRRRGLGTTDPDEAKKLGANIALNRCQDRVDELTQMMHCLEEMVVR